MASREITLGDRIYTVNDVPKDWSDQEAQAWLTKNLADKGPEVVSDTSPVTARDVGRSFASGGLLGGQDEIQAGLGTAMDFAFGDLPMKGIPEQYKHLRDIERQDQAQFAEDHPKIDFAAQMAGGFALPGSAAGSAAKQGWKQLAKTGAKIGAGAGYGTSDSSSIMGDVINTGKGAALGAGIGVAAPWAIDKGVKATQGLGNVVGSTIRDASRQIGSLTRGTSATDELVAGARTMGAAATQADDIANNTVRLRNRADDLDITLTPGERLDLDDLRKIEAGVRSNPWISKPFDEVRRSNQREVNRQAGKAIGLGDDVTELPEQVIGGRWDRLGEKFEDIGKRIDSIELDDVALSNIGQIEQDAVAGFTRTFDIKSTVDNILDTFAKNGNKLSGRMLMRERSKLNNDIFAASTGATKNPNKADALRGILDEVDAMIERQAGGKVLKEYAETRAQWRMTLSLLTGKSITNGNVNPRTFATVLGRNYPKEFRRGGDIVDGVGDDLFDAVRVSNQFGDIVGDSGTATRAAGLQQMTGLAFQGPANAYIHHGGPAMSGVLSQPGMAGRGAARIGSGVLTPANERIN